MIHLFDMLRLLMRCIFGQLLSNYSRYAANLNMKAACQFFFTHPVRISKCTAAADLRHST